MFVIPTFQKISSRYTIEVELNNKPYKLFSDWNSRDSAWYMDIKDKDENDIVTNIKLVPKYLLLSQYKTYSSLPDGNFIIVDVEGKYDTEISFDNFGVRYNMLFFNSGEINGI